jgi:hypothetical protein
LPKLAFGDSGCSTSQPLDASCFFRYLICIRLGACCIVVPQVGSNSQMGDEVGFKLLNIDSILLESSTDTSPCATTHLIVCEETVNALDIVIVRFDVDFVHGGPQEPSIEPTREFSEASSLASITGPQVS